MPVDKFTIFAGYSNVRNANPDTPVTQGQLCWRVPAHSAPTTTPSTAARVLNFYWAGREVRLRLGS